MDSIWFKSGYKFSNLPWPFGPSTTVWEDTMRLRNAAPATKRYTTFHFIYNFYTRNPLQQETNKRGLTNIIKIYR